MKLGALTRNTSIDLFIAVLLVLVIAHSFSKEAHSQETIEDLYKLFKVEEIRSDYLIILDTSGSMNEENRFQNARKALASFMEILAPGDYISIIAFDNLPRL